MPCPGLLSEALQVFPHLIAVSSPGMFHLRAFASLLLPRRFSQDTYMPPLYFLQALVLFRRDLLSLPLILTLGKFNPASSSNIHTSNTFHILFSFLHLLLSLTWGFLVAHGKNHLQCRRHELIPGKILRRKWATPLQYSPENPMDREGARWATVHGA